MKMTKNIKKDIKIVIDLFEKHKKEVTKIIKSANKLDTDQKILFLDTILNTIFHNVEINPPQVLGLLESQKFVLSRHMNNHINIGISNASPPRYTG